MADERDRARALVLAHGWNAACYQVLTPGMLQWFSRAGDAVAGYARYGRIRVVAGAPVCCAARLPDVTAELEDDGRRRGWDTLYFAAGHRLEEIVGALGTHVRVPIGSMPTWNPQSWQEGVAASSGLRAQLNRARNKEVVVHEVPCRPDEVLRLSPVLRAWIASLGLPPLGFMTSTAILEYPGDRRLFVARRHGEAVAYLVAAPVPARGGWLVEQWPREPRAPNGTTQLLIDAAMRAFGAEGSTYATLGLAPLARRGEPDASLPLWLEGLFGWMRAHGRRFYNFAGLEAFKARLVPQAWEPLYVVAPGPTLTPRMLMAVAGAFANGRPVRLMARAAAGSLRAEVSRLLP